jgi:hypothetical protein
MLNRLLPLLALGPFLLTSAVNNPLSNDTRIKITGVKLEGPDCTSSIRKTVIYPGDPTNGTNPMVGAIVTLDAMTATTFPKAPNNISHTDCTVAVDFTLPKGHQMSQAFIVADSKVTWEPGMVRAATLDVWFPTLPNTVVSGHNSHVSVTTQRATNHMYLLGKQRNPHDRWQ